MGLSRHLGRVACEPPDRRDGKSRKRMPAAQLADARRRAVSLPFSHQRFSPAVQPGDHGRQRRAGSVHRHNGAGLGSQCQRLDAHLARCRRSHSTQHLYQRAPDRLHVQLCPAGLGRGQAIGLLGREERSPVAVVDDAFEGRGAGVDAEDGGLHECLYRCRSVRRYW